jgi:hypothetical protein
MDGATNMEQLRLGQAGCAKLPCQRNGSRAQSGGPGGQI